MRQSVGEGRKERRNVYEGKWVGRGQDDNSEVQRLVKCGRATEKTEVL